MQKQRATAKQPKHFSYLFCSLFFISCVSTPKDDVSVTQREKIYWKVYPKSDNTFYILPRPEFTTDLSTPERMNRLSIEQARTLARELNSNLQFRVDVQLEGTERMVRLNPEPLIEDVLEVCKTTLHEHPILEKRCKKELAWEAKGERPDIYLVYDACEAVDMANALNKLYRRSLNSKDQGLCPELPQVEK